VFFDNYSTMVSNLDSTFFLLHNCSFICVNLPMVVSVCILEDTDEFVSS
jgi:hypothetical protein